MTKRPISLYLSLLTILALPTYVVRFQIGLFPTTVLEVLILATFSIWVVEALATRVNPRVLWKRVYHPFFWIGAALVAVSFGEVWVSGDVRSGLGLWRAYFVEPWLFSLVLVDLSRRGFGKYFLWSLIISGIVVSGIALAQIHLKQFVDITQTSALEISYGRAVAIFNSGNALALFLGPLAILSAVLVLKGKYIFVIPLILLPLAILDSKSRGGLIALLSGGLVVSVGYFVHLVRPSLLGKFWYGCAGLFLIITASFAVFFANIAQFAPDLRPEMGRIYNDTGVLRLCLWEGTSNILQDSPVVGSGLSGFSAAYQDSYTCDSEALRYPHNLYLNFWTETGLAGLVLMMMMITLVFILLAKAPDKILALGLGGAFYYLIVHGLVDVPYFKNDLAMQWWILLVVVSLIRENKLQSA